MPLWHLLGWRYARNFKQGCTNHGGIRDPAVALIGTLEATDSNRPDESILFNQNRMIEPPGECVSQDSTETQEAPINIQEDGKLGYGFVSADELEEIDIGDGDKPRPTFVSKKLPEHVNVSMIELLKEFKDCF